MAIQGAATALSPELTSYLRERFGCEDEILRDLRRESVAAGIPAIQIADEQGKFMQVFLKSIGATRVLEIGTLGGYSAIVMARALPPGSELISLELKETHAVFARAFVKRAGLEGVVKIVTGAALETLPSLEGPFDFAFLDADKRNYPHYLEQCVRLVRNGGVIASDNAFAFGQLLDESPTDREAPAMKAFNELVAHDPRFESTIVPVGDGLMLSVVR
jgi:caffeoyl-CoA O-methyltransferase